MPQRLEKLQQRTPSINLCLALQDYFSHEPVCRTDNVFFFIYILAQHVGRWAKATNGFELELRLPASDAKGRSYPCSLLNSPYDQEPFALTIGERQLSPTWPRMAGVRQRKAKGGQKVLQAMIKTAAV